jgi:hypothetical protein
MRESTGEWLAPMLEAAGIQGIDLHPLIDQAKMPAREVDWEAEGEGKARIHKMMEDTPGVAAGAIDWIRYGQLLREKLGWTDYPEWPAPSFHPPRGTEWRTWTRSPLPRRSISIPRA